MTARFRFVVCLQEVGWNPALKNSVCYCPTTGIIFLKMDPAKYTTNLFNPA